MSARLPFRSRGGPPSDQLPSSTCRFFARGFCSRGDTCQFAHNITTFPATPTTTTQASRLNPALKTPCRFFASGNCARGNTCQFKHEEAPNESPTANIAQEPTPDSRASLPCSFFVQGACLYGAKCVFSHAQADQQLQTDAEAIDSAALADQAIVDDWKREFGGSLAEFQIGAAVARITLPSDFSAVRLTGLPQASCPESVAALLQGFVDAVQPSDVRMLPGSDMSGCSAEVRVEDPLFAGAVCKALGHKQASKTVAAVSIPVPMPRGSSVHRVDRRKVLCSWHRSTHMAWLNFGSRVVAEQVGQRFNTGTYRVNGNKVVAVGPTGGGNPQNPVLWTISLANLPGSIQAKDIERDIPPHLRPRHVETGKPSYEATSEAAFALVKSMLTEIGPLEGWETSSTLTGKRYKAQARFLNEQDASDAAKSLNNKRLPFSDTAKLTIQHMTSAKFKVSTRIHDALGQQIASEKTIWESQQIFFVAYPPQQGYRVLKLEGQNSQLVAEAKKTLEKIIAGEVLRKEGKDLWHTSLQRNGDEYQWLKKLQREQGVVILRDKRRSQLRLFGPKASHHVITDALIEFLKNKSVDSDHEVFKLTPEQFHWACRGGFKALEAQLGSNKATFDIIPTPKRIIISGTAADISLAAATITSRKQDRLGILQAAATSDCSACWTDAEDPVQTSCGHVYCADCFANLCQAEGSSTASFSLSCVGDENRCGKLFPMEELQGLLSSAALEDILEASFTSYLRQHPQEFRPCPTPNCNQIYRPAAEGSPSTIFTCNSCLVATCTGCHVPHPGMTCAEHKDYASGGLKALAETKERLGIKDCPKCKTSMEKIEGCNHMTCGGCRAHICWLCLATFDTSGKCYSHLSKQHGGCFDFHIDDRF